MVKKNIVISMSEVNQIKNKGVSIWQLRYYIIQAKSNTNRLQKNGLLSQLL